MEHVTIIYQTSDKIRKKKSKIKFLIFNKTSQRDMNVHLWI